MTLTSPSRDPVQRAQILPYQFAASSVIVLLAPFQAGDGDALHYKFSGLRVVVRNGAVVVKVMMRFHGDLQFWDRPALAACREAFATNTGAFSGTAWFCSCTSDWLGKRFCRHGVSRLLARHTNVFARTRGNVSTACIHFWMGGHCPCHCHAGGENCQIECYCADRCVHDDLLAV